MESQLARYVCRYVAGEDGIVDSRGNTIEIDERALESKGVPASEASLRLDERGFDNQDRLTRSYIRVTRGFAYVRLDIAELPIYPWRRDIGDRRQATGVVGE